MIVYLNALKRFDSHYNAETLQPVDLIRAWGDLPAFSRASCLKYAYRVGAEEHKDDDVFRHKSYFKILDYCRMNDVFMVTLSNNTLSSFRSHSEYVRALIVALNTYDFQKVAFLTLVYYTVNEGFKLNDAE